VIPSSHIDIQTVAGDLLHNTVAAGCGAVLCRHLLYSQAATTKALMPAALMLGVTR
jgi:anaerobic C4-dicarboxylate transporter DcuA